MKYRMKTTHLSITILCIIFSSCANAPAKQKQDTIVNQEISKIEKEDLSEEKVLQPDTQLTDKPLNDSIFEINPAGFIIGHSVNPSWDVAYILFENGNLVYTTYPPNEDIYYKVGRWELEDDSLKFEITKLVSQEGIGKIVKVMPSERHQSGTAYAKYKIEVVDTLIRESFDWNSLKARIKDETHWEWRIEDNRATEYSFDEFDK